MHLYNTFSGKRDELKPLRGKTVRVYSCGPTVYGRAHIGNLRAYVFADVLIRSLNYLGYRALHAMNITDVGHLTSDADEGEDKLDAAARKEKLDPLIIARRYEKAFFSDIKALNIKKPSKIGRATETIKEQQRIIELLQKKGYAYITKTALYFDTSKFTDYGKLSGQSLDQKKALSREELVEDPEKKHPQDFALWMFTVGKHANHVLRWSSPWGEGFPGWHIECSAISRKLLGQPFDIHTGGVDHIGVHHENEIAQSRAAFGVPLAHIWMHNEHLVVSETKMSKSLGNVYVLADILKKQIDPLAFRYFCLQAHYRSLINFTWEGLGAAQQALGELQRVMATVFIPSKTYSPKESRSSRFALALKHLEAFGDAISDDLNTSRALACVWTMLKDASLSLSDKQKLLIDFDRVLGLGLASYRVKRLPLRIRGLVRRREAARSNKQFIHADELRKKIEKVGYGMDDAPEGVYVYTL